MPATQKSTKTSAEKNEITETWFPLYTRSLERLAEFQKKMLEITSQQNTDWTDTWKKFAHTMPQFPGLFMFELWGQMFDRIVETNKGMIDLALEQNQQIMKLAKERGTSFGKATDGFTSLLQTTMDQTVAAQKKVLDFYAEQQKGTFTTMKKQFGFINTPAAEAFESGLETLIETQKAMLDIASKPLHTHVM
jgi:ribosomal protein L11 methylase PrmA